MSNLTIVIALGFLAMGAFALAVPSKVLSVFGVTVASIDGRNEVRAVYGGFGIAIGLLLLAAGGAPSLQPGVIAAVAVALAGMAGGRIVAAFLDGSPGFYPWLFCAIEVAAAAGLAIAGGML
jgi:hypothetical protein